MKTLTSSSRCLVFFILASGFVAVKGQTIQQISQKLSLYVEKYPEESVYLQTDRNTFAPGDILWFSAYIVQELGNRPASSSRDLFVSLIDRDSLEVVHTFFPISHNKSSGSIDIPEQLTSGHYLLIAYTSWMKNMPVDRIFSKEIIIEKENKKALKIHIRLEDTIIARNVAVPAYITVSNREKQPVPSSFNYRITGLKKGPISGTGKTDAQGNAKIMFTLPPADSSDKPQLVIDLDNKKQKSSAVMLLPTAENYLNVNFYPESGMLLYGADNKVAFRGFNIAGGPVDFEGEIYSGDNKLIKRIWSDFKGIGAFQFTPEKNQTYYLKVTSPAGIIKKYGLPLPRRSGMVMSVYEKTPEHLTLSVNEKGKTGQVYHFIVHVKGNVIWMESKKITNNTRIVIPVADIPAGIAECVAFDSVMNLVAKRLVFLNIKKKLTVEITPDKATYAPREKMSLAIEVKNENGNAVHASLSLSALSLNGQKQEDRNSLYTCVMLNNELVGRPPDPAYYFSSDDMAEEVLDNMLIANAYKHFTWRNIMGITENSLSYNMQNDNALAMDMKAEKGRSDYFARQVATLIQFPGITYMQQDKNNMAKLMKPKSSAVPEKNLDSNKDIMDLIFEKKPYKLVNGKIVFISQGPNTMLYEQGAAIAVDGVYRGTDVSVLRNIMRVDIDRVNVSTNPSDVQRYTGLNSTGIIEVYTKGATNAQRMQSEAISNDKSLSVRQFQNPEIPGSGTGGKQKSSLPKTFFWKPEIQTDAAGKATITYFNGMIPGDVVVTIEGISDSGQAVSGSVVYRVK
jgi:hypothetical protein